MLSTSRSDHRKLTPTLRIIIIGNSMLEIQKTRAFKLNDDRHTKEAEPTNAG